MIRVALAAAFMAAGEASHGTEPLGLHIALEQLARDGRFSGAVVVIDSTGTRFARGYGMADPFERRPFTPDTPVDSGSLAKPVTAAIVLMLAREGAIDLDSPVKRYLGEFPDPRTTIRHLLAHSAGLTARQSPEDLAGKSNADLLRAMSGPDAKTLFPTGTGFSYCNLCTVALAILAERVTGKHYLTLARDLVRIPRGVELRPRRLAEWKGRAIGYRRVGGKLERFDSWEGEAFYGPANLSISAMQMAQWGKEWWQAPLTTIRPNATQAAVIATKASGLSWGNWYCAPSRERCHYLGHHEGFHHMLYWDASRRLAVAMVSNNTLEPAFQQRLQRSLVAFAIGQAAAGQRELRAQAPTASPLPGTYRLGPQTLELAAPGGPIMRVRFQGLHYDAYPVSPSVRYVPGLDAYLSGVPKGRLDWLTLYDDYRAAPAAPVKAER